MRIGESRNRSKIVSVLLSASVERVGVSRMQDFFYIGFFFNVVFVKESVLLEYVMY